MCVDPRAGVMQVVMLCSHACGQLLPSDRRRVTRHLIRTEQTMNTMGTRPAAGRTRRWASLKDAADYVSVHPKTLTRRFSDGTLIRYRIADA